MGSGIVAWTGGGDDELALGRVVGLCAIVRHRVVGMGACLGQVHLLLLLKPVLFLQPELVLLILLTAQGGLLERTDTRHGHSARLKVAVSVAH